MRTSFRRGSNCRPPVWAARVALELVAATVAPEALPCPSLGGCPLPKSYHCSRRSGDLHRRSKHSPPSRGSLRVRNAELAVIDRQVPLLRPRVDVGHPSTQGVPVALGSPGVLRWIVSRVLEGI